MKHTRVSLFVATATLLGACAKAPPKVDLALEEKAVRDVSAHWLDLVKEHDAAGAAALFTDDGVMYVAHREPAVGPAAIEAYETRAAGANPKAVVERTTDVIAVAAAGDMAVETGTYHLASAGSNGTGQDSGEYVTVYRKVNGQWKLARNLGSSTMPELKAPAPKPVSLASARRPSKPKPRSSTKVASRTSSRTPAKKGSTKTR